MLKMKIKFFGASGEVGRSCIMISTDKTKILLDSGIKLGRKEEYPVITDEEIKTIDGVFISHAHIDHSGFLPFLYSKSYINNFFATKPTIELINVLLSDYLRINSDLKFEKNIMNSINSRFKMIEFKKEFKFRDLIIKFIPAGHILGSALISISDGKNTLLYTGDINLLKTRLLNGADLRNLDADTLICESTYGGDKDIFPDEKQVAKQLINTINESIKTNSKIIIPSFAVGRAQEILFFLDDYINSGMIPKIPIYVDGMINKVLRIYRHNVIYCKKELQSRILMSDNDPFRSKNFKIVDKKNIRNYIVNAEESNIIVTTSGMLTGGPVMFYLSKLAQNPMNKLILVGYQAQGTLGRDIQDGIKKVTINNIEIDVKLKVETFHISAHADRKRLEQIPMKLKSLKNIFLVHGESTKLEQLKTELSKKYNVKIAQLNTEYEI